MFKPNPSGEEPKLAARLRAEALADRPDFSDALHARWLAALDRRQSDRVVHSSPKGFGVLRRNMRAAWAHAATPSRVAVLTACLLLGGTLLIWWGLEHAETPSDRPVLPNREPIASAQENEIDLFDLAMLADRAKEDLELAIQTRLDEGRWAYLDHDARLAAEALITQLPLDFSAWDTDPEEESDVSPSSSFPVEEGSRPTAG